MGHLISVITMIIVIIIIIITVMIMITHLLDCELLEGRD